MTKKNVAQKNDNFWKENGFLIALYSMVGILVVVALSITFFNPPEQMSTNPYDNEGLAKVDNSLVESYKTKKNERT